MDEIEEQKEKERQAQEVIVDLRGKGPDYTDVKIEEEKEDEKPWYQLWLSHQFSNSIFSKHAQ